MDGCLAGKCLGGKVNESGFDSERVFGVGICVQCRPGLRLLFDEGANNFQCVSDCSVSGGFNATEEDRFLVQAFTANPNKTQFDAGSPFHGVPFGDSGKVDSCANCHPSCDLCDDRLEE